MRPLRALIIELAVVFVGGGMPASWSYSLKLCLGLTARFPGATLRLWGSGKLIDDWFGLGIPSVTVANLPRLSALGEQSFSP